MLSYNGFLLVEIVPSTKSNINMVSCLQWLFDEVYVNLHVLPCPINSQFDLV